MSPRNPPALEPRTTVKCHFCGRDIPVDEWLAWGGGRRVMLCCAGCWMEERDRELAVNKPVKWAVS